MNSKNRLSPLCTAVALLGGVAFADVDVFIGTAGVGHTTPAASVPFGFVQAGPDTSATADSFAGNWDHCAGYRHEDGFVWRFSQTHLFGTGCPSLGDIAVMPFVDGFDPVARAAEKLAETEGGAPGFYALSIREDGATIRCEVAALPHAAVYRFTFPQGRTARLLVDLDWGISPVGRGDCWGKYVFKSVFEPADVPVRGLRGGRKVWMWNGYETHFAMDFSSAATAMRTLRTGDGLRGEIRELTFGGLPGGVLEVRIGLSAGSAAAAARNLAAEASGKTFEAVRAEGAAAWKGLLGRIELSPDTPADVRANFESALYRTMVQPNDLGDVGGRPAYSTFSLWDTFRAAHPLYTVLVPERVPGMVESMLDQCDRQGYLPIWALGGDENHCQVGHHAVPVVVDAYLKGLLPSGQAERAYRAVRQSLTVNHKAINDGTWGLTKEDWDVLDRYGYYPYDKLTGVYRGDVVKGESVSRTLECAYDDACAARFAAALGKADDARFFGRRAGYWKNVYDASVGYVRGRDSKGNWREPFSPYAMGAGPWRDNDFCEGNSHQFTWHVMHDPAGLVELLGGKVRAGERLDELFSARATDHAVDGDDTNCTGCIGQYAHGNEPSHHVAYMYAYTDRPWRTADIVREVFDRLYRPAPDGLCGNDDCGQMAAWYVFSALGFYPLDPCGGEYVLGAPQVPMAQVKVGGEGERRTFRVFAKGLSKANKYVKSVTLNGKPVADRKIRHADIVKGGELVFEMCEKP